MTQPTDTPQHGYTLITGGSQGIGRAIAAACAEQGHGLVLVALPNDFLNKTAADLRDRYGVEVHTFGADLTQVESIDRTMDWLDRSGFRITRLVNNVGFGRSGLLHAHPITEYRKMMRLNNEAAVALTYALLPHLKANRGSILNVSSMEATLPLPYKAVYTGTKSFIYAFSLAMREELRPYGVGVSVLCPGPVLTNEDNQRRAAAQGSRSKLLLMLPEEIGPVAVSQWLQGRGVIIPGRFPKAIVRIMHFIPLKLKMRILERIFSRYK
jgi:short-subunit dehydrogenase